MIMRTAGIAIAIFLLAGLLPVNAVEPLAVVTKADSPLAALSLENLKRVYLRKSLLDETGKRWIPLNMPPSSALRRAFSLALFAMLPEDQEEYWNNQYFQGINPPEVMASEEAVLRFVALTPGAVGYVRRQSVDARVKVLAVITPPVD